MNLLASYYHDMNLIEDWRKKHSSSAKEVSMFAFKGTNGRSLASLIDVFTMMEEVEGVERKKWERVETTGQEKHKQYPIRMLEAKLFYRNVEGIFYKTEKGKAYKRFIEKRFGENEKWAINYIFLLDSYFEETSSYLINRSKELLNMISLSAEEEYVKTSIQVFLEKADTIKSFDDLIQYDIFYLCSFYDDSDFIDKYFHSNEEEKQELREYVLNNYHSGKFSCCLSYKFKPGGVYNVSQFKDDILILGISLSILNDMNENSFYMILSEIIVKIRRYISFNIKPVTDFLQAESEVIEPILMNIYGLDGEKNPDEDEEEESISVKPVVPTGELDHPEEKVDDTTIKGKQYLNSKFNYRKNISRQLSNYKCELEQYKDCRYFTSKKTGHNYVEVHHFVPREFRNNYEYSIDVFANYITLCPHCHKMIHLATDRERMDAIRYIYNKRAGRLQKCGINVELKDLLKYYKVTQI